MDVLRRFGFEVYYGDVTRLGLLESAGAAEAELLIITLGDHETSMVLVELMIQDREIDMAELDKAWTAANPET